MAGVMVEMLLAVLSVTLLLVPTQGWKHVGWTQLANSDEPEQWRKPQIVTLPDDSPFLDSEKDEAPEYVLPGVKGASTVENINPFTDHGFQVDDHPRSWNSDADGFQMEFADAPPKSWTSSHSSSVLEVVCSEVGFQITLLAGSLSEVTVLGSKKLLPVMDAPKSCGYEVDSFTNTLTVPFTGCNVKHTDRYSLQLLYVDEIGQTQVATASCEENPKFGPRFSGKSKSKCSKPVSTPPPSNPSTHSSCDIPSAEQLACGLKGISSSTCEMRGCCASSSGCYYPLDACTAGNFVFAIRFDSTSIPLDPTKLIIPGSPNCKPVLVNDKVAIFKFKVTECGARSYEVGETTIYLAEVQSVIQTLNLKYGIITRSNLLKFMVECRYNKLGASQQELATVGYMVQTPSSSLPSSIISHGLYGVTLRIAHDETYSSYFPTYHQPLRLLLGKPVYLELLLKSPKPDAVILVNYCLAYPRSAKNALVLIYEGCANPYDPTSAVLKVIDLPKNRHQRRFLVQAFQFMDQKTNKYLDEEIYFMCSTEVCRTDEKTCGEQCFDGKVNIPVLPDLARQISNLGPVKTSPKQATFSTGPH
ncbi:zona pellucida sperm-binding protein 4-like [Etheostoma cragini]|uniref:zona pellucida sperm-binding protein 4-like n=1 Tax=Etheostoma cragini TaxID=417921 RepID=UPI00155EFE66|nr:zona pellucida sperm-binding protein 4-like [Etheostoma cragini]